MSHSRDLVAALVELVKQVSSQEIPIAGAAGVGPDRQEPGTDAVEIAGAIQSVYHSDGVVILMDLGSAILSAEMALEFLPGEMRPNIRFCAAPIVEGAISAAVQIGLGHDLERVCQEAQDSLLPKIDQLSESDEKRDEDRKKQVFSEKPDFSQDVEKDSQKKIVLTITTPHGLHARPAARFVQTATAFDAEIQVAKLSPPQQSSLENVGRDSVLVHAQVNLHPQQVSRSESRHANSFEGDQGGVMPLEGDREVLEGPVSATSLTSLAMLSVGHGDQILVSARGREADQALIALSRLVEENFGEDSTDIPAPDTVPEKSALHKKNTATIPISDGIAIGPAFQYQISQLQVPEYRIENPAAEWERLQNAISVARQTLQQHRQQVKNNLGSSQAAIFDAHLLTLEDTAILEQTREQIFQNHFNAAAAWKSSIENVADSYQRLPDAYLQQRAVDVLDVGNQVLLALLGDTTSVSLSFSEPVILIAHELTPTLIAQLDTNQVLGVVTAVGGPTSHGAILVRNLGIPAVVAPRSLLEDVFPSREEPEVDLSPLEDDRGGLGISSVTTLAIDGFSGELWIDPSPQILKELDKRRSDWVRQREQLLTDSHQPAVTCDGRCLKIAANAGSVLDANIALRNGAEAIGVLRTEFLYLTRSSPPSETEQVEILSQIGSAMNNFPVYVRTLDIGGDKGLPYLKLAAEANPFLGIRSIRLSLRSPEIFHTQLRAILRAGANFDIRVMFPMISKTEEIIQTLQHLETAHQSLENENISHRWPIKISMMIETPSAALLTSSFAQYVDYFSIGTNDLTQYTLAAERGNPDLADYADALHPSVLYLIRHVADAAHQHGKHVGVCGEIAGDPVAVPVLVGLGVDELSMNPGRIPQIKALIRTLDMDSVSILAEDVLQTSSATEVRRITEDFAARF